MLHTLLVIIHVLICIVLATVVLLQSSKGGGLAGAFGGAGGAPQQLLGSRGMTTLLHKLTIYLAVGFFLTSFLLFMTDTSGTARTADSVVGEAAREGQINVPQQQEAPIETPLEAPAETPTEAPVQDAGQGTDDQGGGQ
jgi:preprotein translocase subunit SecG